MYQKGHYGISLLVYSPVALALLSAGHDGLAVLGGAVAVTFATLPDCDHSIPFVQHRGATHTVAFALFVGAFVGWIGLAVGSRLDVTNAQRLGRFLFGVTTLTILSHLLADVITPMGIRPFWPLSRRHFSLSLVPANHRVANQLLLILGTATIVLVVLVARGGLGVVR